MTTFVWMEESETNREGCSNHRLDYLLPWIFLSWLKTKQRYIPTDRPHQLFLIFCRMNESIYERSMQSDHQRFFAPQRLLEHYLYEEKTVMMILKKGHLAWSRWLWFQGRTELLNLRDPCWMACNSVIGMEDAQCLKELLSIDDCNYFSYSM